MPSKITLNAQNLEALGAKRLAELLIEISIGNAAAKRRVRLELAASQSPIELTKAIRKRLMTIARAKSFIDWQNRKALLQDLDTQRRAIVDQVAKADLDEALELMWRFVSLANSVFERCDDSSGTMIGLFHAACEDLGAIAQAAEISTEVLAGQIFAALNENDYGQYDYLIRFTTPALGASGLNQLKERLLECAKVAPRIPMLKDRQVIGVGPGGALYADEIASHRCEGMIRLALQEIADAQGDVDGYIAQQSEKAKSMPGVAAEISQRLLKAGRVEEAWSAINAVNENNFRSNLFQWEEARLEVMEAQERKLDAQAFRWECFERTLKSDHLRAYLKRLPDFEDIEAEERAISYVLKFPNVHHALAFLLSWPALDKAAALATRRSGEFNGDHYEILSPAAESLGVNYPLAATLLLRAMIDFSLKHAKATRYRHAARHFAECASLASGIIDFGSFETHSQFNDRLKEEYGRRTSFWALVIDAIA